jgi:hypothetical protein
LGLSILSRILLMATLDRQLVTLLLYHFSGKTGGRGGAGQ